MRTEEATTGQQAKGQRTRPAATQSPDALIAIVREFLLRHPNSVLLEHGRVLFDLAIAQYTLESRSGACVLHLWSSQQSSSQQSFSQQNLVRRILTATPRGAVLRLEALRFGQRRAQSLELTPARAVRFSGTQEARRRNFAAALTGVLERSFPGERATPLRSVTDLERSFGPAFCRGSLVRGREAWAVVAVSEDESQATVDGILSIGLLWLEHLREQHAGRLHYRGLRLVLPEGTAATTLARLRWLRADRAAFELYTRNPVTGELTRQDPTDRGNRILLLGHAPNGAAMEARFAPAIAQVVALLPPNCPVFLNGAMATCVATPHRMDMKVPELPGLTSPLHRRHALLIPEALPSCELRLRSSTEVAFLCHGLTFAHIRSAPAPGSFRYHFEITVGHGAAETVLSETNAADLRCLVAQLFLRRHPAGEGADELFRAQPERWLESMLLTQLAALEPTLGAGPVYAQVPASTGAGTSLDRGVLDLLTVTHDDQLAVIEVKANEDLHLALQGLDYWLRVREYHLGETDPVTGLGGLQRLGYFPDRRLAAEPPHLYLVAPALRIHPATETILRYLDPAVRWTLVALDERWRSQIKPVWRRRSGSDGAL